MKGLFFYCCLFLAFTSNAQQNPGDFDARMTALNKRHIAVLGGYSFWTYHNAELGAALYRTGNDVHHPISTVAFISSEVFIDKNPIIGPKIGVWASGGNAGLALGGSLIYYSDFSQGSLRFRPEIGIGLHTFKITYGYNLRLTNRSFDQLNRHVVSLTLLFPVYERKSKPFK